ncbi:hypothetical protein [Paraburkholderia lacunae]|uniref:Uncharacterized protein n=1 Tax=Paraburkholderia lacunae TaxID=2211104 RepID=A0A370MW90_9BURK|nr:hypothetical protein [Paraburkholderia lacunae]RDJ97576.1 hypothetical protein DLM46_37040 [Paraburkholderia lacunae]
MHNAFSMQSDDASLQPPRGSAEQSAFVSHTHAEKVSDDTLLDSLVTLSKANGTTVVQHGARLAVLGELLASLLTHLPHSMRVAIAASFRNRIEDLMSLSDDRCLPEKYHSALLTEVNRYLNALR